MAKRITVVTLPDKTVEACPHGGVYLTTRITINATIYVLGDMAVYESTSVEDNFDPDGLADIYVDGVFAKTIVYDPPRVVGKEYA